MKQLSGSDIQSMKSVDIKSVDKDTLVDLNAVQRGHEWRQRSAV